MFLLDLTQKNIKKRIFYSAENQRFIKKVHFFCIFFAKIFGQFKNLLYLCTRF